MHSYDDWLTGGRGTGPSQSFVSLVLQVFGNPKESDPIRQHFQNFYSCIKHYKTLGVLLFGGVYNTEAICVYESMMYTRHKISHGSKAQ